MDLAIKGGINKGRNMGLGYLNGKIALCMKDISGKMIFMGKVIVG